MRIRNERLFHIFIFSSCIFFGGGRAFASAKNVLNQFLCDRSKTKSQNVPFAPCHPAFGRHVFVFGLRCHGCHSLGLFFCHAKQNIWKWCERWSRLPRSNVQKTTKNCDPFCDGGAGMAQIFYGYIDLMHVELKIEIISATHYQFMPRIPWISLEGIEVNE